MCRLNPKVDFAFKKLFGSEENKDILMAFINSMMDEDKQIKKIILKNPYNIANYQKGKMSILDIKAQDQNETWYDIEMQIAEQAYYDKRALYYWAKVYSDQIESGEHFDELKKTISINILDFNYLEEEEYHNIYDIYNRKTKKQFSDVFEMHFIELTKFNKDFKDLRTGLDKWTAFLSKAYEIDVNSIPKELEDSDEIRNAIKKLDIMYLDKEEKEIYENELKKLMVSRAELKTAERKGRLEGELKAKRESILELLKEKFNLTEEVSNEINNKLIDIKDLEVLGDLFKKAIRCNELKEILE